MNAAPARLNARSARRAVAASLVLTLALAAPLRADVVHLSRGRKVEGEIVGENEKSVVVSVGAGRVTIDRADVVRIERVATPAQRIREARAKLTVGDARGAVALADAAAAARLVDEEGAALRLAVEWDPRDAVAASRLRRWTRANVRLEIDEGESARLVGGIGAHARLHRSMHWALASDGSSEDAARAARAMETVWEKFHAFADRLGVETKPVDRALTAQIFTGHDAWAAAAEASAPVVWDSLSAYVLAGGRVLLHDAATRPDAHRLVAAARAVSDELARADAAEYRLHLDLAAFAQEMHFARMTALTVRLDVVRNLQALIQRRRDVEFRAWTSLREARARLESDLTAAAPVLRGDEGWDLAARVHDALVEIDDESADREELLAALLSAQVDLGAWDDEGYIVFDAQELLDLENLVAPLDGLAQEIRRATTGRRARLDAIGKDLEGAFSASNVAAASHAACHQIAFATGLNTADDPHWLVDGLATMFELTDGRSLLWEKPQLQRLRAARDAWRTAPAGWLATLVSGKTFVDDSETAYSAAYVVVWYLCRERPAQFAGFLRRTRTPPSADPDADVREFEKHFGGIDAIEAELPRYVEHR